MLQDLLLRKTGFVSEYDTTNAKKVQVRGRKYKNTISRITMRPLFQNKKSALKSEKTLYKPLKMRYTERMTFKKRAMKSKVNYKTPRGIHTHSLGGNKMKKLATMLKIALVMAAALLLGGGCDDGIDWLGRSRVNFKVDNEIKTCFKLVNEFRTGNEAWYYSDETKTDKTTVEGLEELTLDENLCKAAAIRAQEIVKKFSHTRPNGKDCFTVLNECGISYGYAAENIAMGNTSGAKTFNQWKEDDLPKSQQGHRINMLSEKAKKIGIAHDSSGRYWVMILI